MIIHNATIHSPVERFATSLQVEQSTIVWMGDEDTAQFRIKANPEEPVVDAGGQLLTPTFHNTFEVERKSETLLSLGITAAHIGEELEFTGLEHIDVTPLVSRGQEGPAVALLPSGASADAMNEHLHQSYPSQCEPGLTISSPEDVEQFQALGSIPPLTRVVLHSQLSVDVSLFAHCQVVVVVEEEIEVNLHSFTTEGIPFALAGSSNPWEIISSALHFGPGPLTARAGFNAITRGAWRLTPGQYEPRGILRVGAPADFALWDVDALTVQVPHDEAATWSTDQRAGTPLLPVLGLNETLPTLEHVWKCGRSVFDPKTL